jgi:hypothetical protein
VKNTQKMLSSKKCPKCSQNSIYLDFDFYGWFECCWNCGYYKDLPLKKNNGARWMGLTDSGAV